MSASRLRWFVAVTTLAVLSPGHSPLSAAPEPGAAVAILVELFTAEGCSSCPPADVLLDKMLAAQPASGALLIGLGEHVDYWDRSGWKDRFASASLTRRQQQYADRAKGEEIYTPEMVIDGGTGFVGSDVNEARRAIEAAVAVPHGVIRLQIDPQSRRGDKVGVQIEIAGLPSSTGDTADLVVAATEDGLRTELKRGENQGHTLTHAAVVRTMQTVGPVTAPEHSARAAVGVARQWRRDHVKLVAFVQERRSRRVLASAALPLEGDR
jgi:hypothetical protein